MQQLWDTILDNDYIVLSLGTSLVVIIPILFCYLIGFTKHVLALMH